MQEQEFPDALPLGVVVGGYRLTRVIGQGGFGITYEAVNAAGVLERRVAIKEFFPRGHAYRQGTEIRLSSSIDRATWASVERRFEAEALKLADAYDHPAIVRGENFVREHGSSFLIMEFVEGPSLAQWLASLPAPADEAQVRAVMEPVLDAVAYLHGRDDMHRDISPHNILVRLERRGRKVLEPVLIDFGAAGAGLNLGRQSSVVVANQTYAPLEQLRPNAGAQGAYTDIYALGGVLYYCVAGRASVSAEDRATAMSMGRADGDYVPAAGLPGARRFSAAFLAGIDQAMSIRAEDRPQTVAELSAALGWAAAPAPPIEARPATAAGLAGTAGVGAGRAPGGPVSLPADGPASGPKTGGRRAARVMGLLVLGLGVAAGAGWYISQRAPSPEAPKREQQAKVVPPAAAPAPKVPSPTTEATRPPATAESFGPQVEALMAACDQGNRSKCVDAGNQFDFGRGVPRDEKRAVDLFLKACDGGDAVGCSNAAYRFQNGNGVSKDPKRAVRLHMKVCELSAAIIGCGSALDLIKAGALPTRDPEVAAFLSKRCAAHDQDACKLAEPAKAKAAAPSFGPEMDALLKACDAGAYEDCNNAGYQFANGGGAPEDQKRTAALYLKACHGGLSFVCGNAASQFASGKGVAEDQKRATELFLKACDGGAALGCNNAGYQLRDGRGVPEDQKRATELFLKACDGEVAPGCEAAGNQFLHGRGVPEDQKRATELFLKGCDSGSFASAGSCSEAGVQLAHGLGVPEDQKRATELFLKACDGGGAVGCSNAGYQFAGGLGVPEDQKRATELYLKACDGGVAASCVDAGGQFFHGRGVPEDQKRATELYLKACDGGYAMGCSSVGYQFEKGRGVPEDQKRATELYLKACDGGEALGCNNAGYQFDKGRGVPEDQTRATELYLKACDREGAMGCSNAGNQFEKGQGVPKDRKRAIRLYMKACERDAMSAGCASALSSIKAGVLPVSDDEVAAFLAARCKAKDKDACALQKAAGKG